MDPQRLTPCLSFAIGNEFFQDGIDILEELRRHDNHTDAALVNTLGVLYLYTGKLQENLFEIALEKEPTSPLFLTNLGSIHWETGRLRQAADCWMKALAVDVEYQRADYLLQYLQATHSQETAKLPLDGPREGRLTLPYLPSIPQALPIYSVLLKRGRVAGEVELQFPQIKNDRMFIFAKGRKTILASWDPHGLYLDTATVTRVEPNGRAIHLSVSETSLRLQRRRLIRVLAFDETTGQVRTAPDQPFSRVDILTLSAGGISFRAPWFLSRNQTMDVTLQLGTETLSVTARVVWARPVARRFVYGAEFLLAEQAKDEIARFIHQRQIALRKIDHR